MAAYIVATVSVTDPVKIAAYVKAIAGLTEAHGGEYLLRGKIAEVLEGEVDPDQLVVVSRFPTAEAARGCANAPEYLAAAKLREGGGVVVRRLLIDPA